MSHICPYCKQPINDDEALLCHFCGESLGRSSSGMLGKFKDSFNQWIWVGIISVVVLSFLILLLRLK